MWQLAAAHRWLDVSLKVTKGCATDLLLGVCPQVAKDWATACCKGDTTLLATANAWVARTDLGISVVSYVSTTHPP